ncbi:MAG: SLBB domain-containing protein [bacterium]
MRSSKLAVVVVVLMAGLGAALPAVGQPQNGDYILGPGDTIEIAFFGDPDLSRAVTIKPDGMIALSLIGDVKAAGMTTTQLAAHLVKLYSKYKKAPSISVGVTQFRVDRFYILGQVNRPGEYEIRHGIGILELLASAGGPTNRADLAKAVIIRNGKETIQLDLLTAIATSKSPNVQVAPKDVLFVPETDRRMVVLGQVNRPGSYELLEGQRVTDLIAAAGGITQRAATGGFLVRGTAQVPVDLQKALSGVTDANVPLKTGDMLVVPENQNRIAVLGAVVRPGTYDLIDGTKLVDAIAMAGGHSEKGNLGQVVVIRLEGTTTKTITANVDNALKLQDMTQNVLLQRGDVVFVPERGLTVTDVVRYLSLANLFRIFFRFP